LNRLVAQPQIRDAHTIHVQEEVMVPAQQSKEVIEPLLQWPPSVVVTEMPLAAQSRNVAGGAQRWEISRRIAWLDYPSVAPRCFSQTQGTAPRSPMPLRTGKTTRVGFGWTVRNGVGSRFRATINHMESGLPENDSRPLPRNPTLIHLVVLGESGRVLIAG
jgi:hypothetical protein